MGVRPLSKKKEQEDLKVPKKKDPWRTGGNPNPFPAPENLHAGRVRAGETANRAGIGKVTYGRINRNSERSIRIRAIFLDALERRLVAAAEAGNVDLMMKELRPDVLRLLTDTENRGLGTPRQSIEMSGPNGSPLQAITAEMTPQQAAEAFRASLAAPTGARLSGDVITEADDDEDDAQPETIDRPVSDEDIKWQE